MADKPLTEPRRVFGTLPLSDDELLEFHGEIIRHKEAQRVRVTFNLERVEDLLTTALNYRRMWRDERKPDAR